MNSYDSRFERELRNRLNEELARLRDVLEIGSAIKDYAEYKNHVGQIHALKRVISEFCQEIQTIIEKG